MIAFLILETLMIGVFCALDLVLFYVFFEASLIPNVYYYWGLGLQGPNVFLAARSSKTGSMRRLNFSSTPCLARC